ncbi:MAG: hypothetical protein OEY83_03205 [Candidatus Bathyarchaeota archaeon]|nr:hypothetical protein [Candidatus Bathyarchaeota archaeon]
MVKLKVLQVSILVACLLTTLAMTSVSADNLLKTDFQEESFAKTVDYFEYARALALLHGLPKIPNYWHANVYMTYVNKMGLKMLYAGLCNISLVNQVFITIPMQTFLIHYKTENNSRDALVASSYLMLMGFNDTAKSIYPDSPDRNDTLWASFSLGFNLEEWFPNAKFPSLHSKTEIFPLTHSDNNLTWSWGMRYTNLTAVWWRTYISENNETKASRPWGLASYDELTFKYTLTIDPDTHKATITENHVIGRIRDLWVFHGWFLIPLYNHFNRTGCYAYGTKLSNETVYDFLYKHGVKMSIVDFQTSIMLDRDTYSTSTSGQNVTDNEVLVSNSSISTYADDGEKIFDASFGAKQTYNLFNYTKDPTESTSDTYDAVTRTPKIGGYAKNRDLFKFHRNFGRYLPLILVHMYPNLYQRAKETITNMTRADYLFLISYPNYSGYRIEHDPLFTIYFAPTATTGTNYGALIVLAIVGGVAIATVAIVISRKKKSRQTAQQ